MKIYSLFAGRHVMLAAVLLGILVSLPTLSSGLFLDDYEQRIALMPGGDGEVFTTFHRGTATTEALLQTGVRPWWMHPDAKIMFYRPVAQWLVRLDYRLWPDSLRMMHLVSVLWYGLAVLVAGLGYRRIVPTPWAAGLAAILFAVDAAHGPAVAWLCNRNAFICLAACLLVLLCYRQRQLLWQLAGCGLFLLGLGCSEAALAIIGYLFAHELCLSDRPWRDRILRLSPYALIGFAWLAIWKHRGFGTAGPGWYIDPGSEPGRFLSEMVFRVPAYLVGQFFLPPADLFAFLQDPPARAYALAYAILVAALLAWLLAPLLRSSRVARFFGLGMMIAVIPICGSAPVGRSLWFVGFGASGLLALYVEQFRGLALTPARMRCSAIFATTMMVLHLWISPLLFVAYGKTGDVLDGIMDSRRVQLPDEGAPGRKVLALSVLDYTNNITFPLFKDRALSLGGAPTRPAPGIARIRALSEGTGEFELLRQDEDTLLVSSAVGLGALRPARYGFTAGDRVLLDDVEIVVRSVSPARAPTLIEYRFSPGVLDRYEVIAWRHDHFVPASLPAVGERLSIKTQG